MHLGLLNAYTPTEEKLRERNVLSKFENLLIPKAKELHITEYRITEDQFPESPQECDAYLISGSPSSSFWDEPWIDNLSTFIKESYEAKKKMVGICFGHQILAHVLGGKTERSVKGLGLGPYEVEIYNKQIWMEPSLETNILYYQHQDQVVKLPDDAVLLAGNEFCPIAMYTMNDLVFGVQGHPDYSDQIMIDAVHKALDKADSDWLKQVESPAKIDKGNRADPGWLMQVEEDTPAESVDNNIVGHWIVNFLNLPIND